MGADLYINHKPMSEEERYFRDSYNATSVLWAMGLSWWKDVIPRLDNEGNLAQDGIRWLLTEVEARDLSSVNREYLVRQWAADCDTDAQVAEWVAYFTDKRQRFIAYLQHALSLNATIYCSL